MGCLLFSIIATKDKVPLQSVILQPRQPGGASEIAVRQLSSLTSKLLLRCLVRAAVILPHRLFVFFLVVRLEELDVLAVHHPCHPVCLPLLEGEARASVRVVLPVRLVFVVFDLRKVRIRRGRVERERHDGVDGG